MSSFDALMNYWNSSYAYMRLERFLRFSFNIYTRTSFSSFGIPYLTLLASNSSSKASMYLVCNCSISSCVGFGFLFTSTGDPTTTSICRLRSESCHNLFNPTLTVINSYKVMLNYSEYATKLRKKFQVKINVIRL